MQMGMIQEDVSVDGGGGGGGMAAGIIVVGVI